MTVTVVEGGRGSDREALKERDDESWLRKFCYKGDPISAISSTPYAFSVNPVDSLH
jgi:hypothetical protein